MIICGVDFEATDKEPKTARITEIGAICFDTEGDVWQPVGGGFSALVWDSTYPPLPEEVVRVTGLTDEKLRAEGQDPKQALTDFLTIAAHAEFLIAYNTDFDRVLLEEEMKRHGISPLIPAERWLCAHKDVKYPEFYRCRKLSHLALDHGVRVDPAKLHRAVGDVLLMGELLTQGKYTAKEIIEYSRIPWVTVAVADKSYSVERNALAKERQYRWQEAGGKTYPKTWVKRLKKNELEREVKDAPFRVIVLEGA